MPELSTQTTTMVALLSASLAKHVIGALLVRRHRTAVDRILVGAVSEINCYPIKSCRGFSVSDAFCTSLGLTVDCCSDRHWVVTRANGDFVTQRQLPEMALIGTEVKDGDLILSAPDVTPLVVALSLPVTETNVVPCRVWDNRLRAVDCGPEAGQWLSSVLQKPGLRLLWSAPSMPKVDMTVKVKPWGNPALPGDKCVFTDYCPYLIATESSLQDLNGRLSQPVPMKSFRPNIVIKGCPAFDEDTWAEMVIGTTVFRMLDPCTRCLLTTVDQDKGVRDPQCEPLATLRKFRCFPDYGNSPLFGVNAALQADGVIKIGDPVYVIRK